MKLLGKRLKKKNNKRENKQTKVKIMKLVDHQVNQREKLVVGLEMLVKHKSQKKLKVEVVSKETKNQEKKIKVEVLQEVHHAKMMKVDLLEEVLQRKTVMKRRKMVTEDQEAQNQQPLILDLVDLEIQTLVQIEVDQQIEEEEVERSEME